ncbi:hypothetical protein EBX31_05385 [bacterium]|nr:hypothetical protein [bacterium]
MIITGATLTAGVVLTVGAHFYKAHAKNPHFPFWVGMGLSLLIPTFLMAMVFELIMLLAWNPLVWLE